MCCVSICKTNIANVKLRENKLVYRKLYKIVSAALNNTKHKSPSKAIHQSANSSFVIIYFWLNYPLDLDSLYNEMNRFIDRVV